MHKTLTSVTINIMKAEGLWEASLVAEAIKGFDTWLGPSTTLSGGYDRITHAAIR